MQVFPNGGSLGLADARGGWRRLARRRALVAACDVGRSDLHFRFLCVNLAKAHRTHLAAYVTGDNNDCFTRCPFVKMG